jgi:hypothetical protein
MMRLDLPFSILILKITALVEILYYQNSIIIKEIVHDTSTKRYYRN